MQAAVIRVDDFVEFMPTRNSAVLSEISDEWETERAYLNMEAT